MCDDGNVPDRLDAARARELALDAQGVAQNLVEAYRTIMAPSEWKPNVARSLLGGVLIVLAASDLGSDVTDRRAKLVEAEVLLAAAYQVLSSHPRKAYESSDSTRRLLENLVRLYQTWEELSPDAKHVEKIAQWRQRLQEFTRNATVPP